MKSLLQSLPIKGRTLALLAVLVPMLVVFIYVGLRSGPLAPVSVTVAKVQSRSLEPSLFGIGTVNARFRHAIGPTFAGRLASLTVDVGESVHAGQLLGEMDAIDLDDRIVAQDAAIARATASLAEAQVRLDFAQMQAKRYEDLFAVRSTSQELLANKQQELRLTQFALNVAGRELARIQAERAGLQAQRDNLKLISPIDGLVVKRDVESGTTVVAGQAVIEIIDPRNLWINTRFDQINATGLAQGQKAEIVLRSHRGQPLAGVVNRVEPLADAVTEEMLAKVSFTQTPETLPPIGELAEVTVKLSGLPAITVIPNAAIRRNGSQPIVWRIVNTSLKSTSITLGISDLDGYVQVIDGLAEGDEIVVYSNAELKADSPIRVVTDIAGAGQ
jgi:HlyD family secretion protein